MIKQINYKSIVDNGVNKDTQQFKTLGEYIEHKDYIEINFVYNQTQFYMHYNDEEVTLGNGISEIKMNRYQYLTCEYNVGDYKLELEAQLEDIRIKDKQVLLLYHLFQNGKEIVKNYINIKLEDYLQ